MKIFNLGLAITPGKYQYKGDYFGKLVEKFSPQKATPYTVEFIEDENIPCDAVLYHPDRKLDLIVSDLEKVETRLSRSSDEKERVALSRLKQSFEAEILACDAELTADEREYLKTLPLVTAKPCLCRSQAADLEATVKDILAKARAQLFYTVGKKEVRAWNLKAGDTALDAAGRIHSDLKRGFIKADIVHCSDFDNFFNMAEARARGLVKVVERDYIMQPYDLIEIRFSV